MTGSSEINTSSRLRITGLGFQTIGTAKINTSSCLQITGLHKKKTGLSLQMTGFG